MPIELIPLPIPDSADPKLAKFGREVIGLHPAQVTKQEFTELEKALYQYNILLFRNIDLTPKEQYVFVKRFDPPADTYGHGAKYGETKTGALKTYANVLPDTPQVTFIGNGTISNHEGIEKATLTHGHHSERHETVISPEDEAKGYTRFYRWHMDAALYGRDLRPPKVTALYGIKIPDGPKQTVRYDDGSGDVLPVPLGTTAFESAKTMFDLLPPELKSIAVRAQARYAPKPFEWMENVRTRSTGFGVLSEGREKDLDCLRPWSEEDIQTLPFCWKNPFTGDLHLMVHSGAIMEMMVEPVSELRRGNSSVEQLYPNGAHIKDLEEIRNLLWKMQRPGIDPSLVYPHNWQEKDLLLWHNRGVMHSVVGHFRGGDIRLLHQCNLAASDLPDGPSEQDRMLWE
ncbi:Clavaminate synthase-like protein [Marasmius fiardii PR-910]|nr:Clavaminate synthase-like protein [Marasmius fiardii PR-910]